MRVLDSRACPGGESRKQTLPLDLCRTDTGAELTNRVPQHLAQTQTPPLDLDSPAARALGPQAGGAGGRGGGPVAQQLDIHDPSID